MTINGNKRPKSPRNSKNYFKDANIAAKSLYRLWIKYETWAADKYHAPKRTQTFYSFNSKPPHEAYQSLVKLFNNRSADVVAARIYDNLKDKKDNLLEILK